MSTAPQPAEPLPQPPVTPEAIRAALAIPAPLHRLVSHWAVEVAHARRPDRLARLRELEKAAQTADDQELPAILSAIRAIVLEATAEAGFTRDAR